MSVRISASDWVEGGITPDDAVQIARAFKAAGADLIDCSSGQVSKQERPVFGRMFQTPFADRVRNEAGIATIAVGAITEADHVNSIIAAGRADLCAVARPHLANPAWTLMEAAQHRLCRCGLAEAVPRRQGPARTQPRARTRRGVRPPVRSRHWRRPTPRSASERDDPRRRLPCAAQRCAGTRPRGPRRQRRPRGAAAVAAHARQHDADRGRDPAPAARALLDLAGALRLHGAAVPLSTTG